MKKNFGKKEPKHIQKKLNIQINGIKRIIKLWLDQKRKYKKDKKYLM